MFLSGLKHKSKTHLFIVICNLFWFFVSLKPHQIPLQKYYRKFIKKENIAFHFVWNLHDNFFNALAANNCALDPLKLLFVKDFVLFYFQPPYNKR